MDGVLVLPGRVRKGLRRGVFHRALPKGPPHLVAQFGGAEWLGQEIISRFCFDGVGRTGRHDDGGLWVQLCESRCEGVTAHAGHLEIGEKQVDGLFAACDAQGARSIRCCEHPITGSAENDLDQLPNWDAVVDEKDGFHSSGKNDLCAHVGDHGRMQRHPCRFIRISLLGRSHFVYWIGL